MFNHKNFKITKKETERIEDTNPEIYYERYNIEFKNKNYDKAISEINKAIKFSTNSKNKKIYIKEKVSTLRLSENEEKIVECIEKNFNFLIANMVVIDFISFISQYVKKSNNIICIFERLFSCRDLNMKRILQIDRIKALNDKKFLYNYINKNIEKIIELSDLENFIEGIKAINLNKRWKLNIIENLQGLYKENFEILNYLIELGDLNFVDKVMKSYLKNFQFKYGIDEFVKNLRELNLDPTIKKKYLKKMLKNNNESLEILDEILFYYGQNTKEDMEYLNFVINNYYSNFDKLALIYLREGKLFYKDNNFYDSKSSLEKALKLAKKENISGKEYGEILFNLSLAYCGLAQIKKPYMNYRLGKKYFKKACKYGYFGRLPKDLERDSRWEQNDRNRKRLILILVVIVAFFIYYKSKEIKESKKNTIGSGIIKQNSEKSQDEIWNDVSNSIDNYKDNESKISNDGFEKKKNEKEVNNNFLNKSLYNNNIVYNIYTNAYKDRNNASSELSLVESKGINAMITEENGYYKVLVGNAESLGDAKDKSQKISKILNQEVYILVLDKDIEKELDDAKYYINLGYIDNAKSNLEKIKNQINMPGYENYKKIYDNLYSDINNKSSNLDLENMKSEISNLLVDMLTEYGVAIDEGNPQIVNKYLINNGELYNSFSKSIPKYYKEGIHVRALNYLINKIDKQKDGVYRVNCDVVYSITNKSDTREQKEQMDYIIVSNYGKLLIDRIENWKIIKN